MSENDDWALPTAEDEETHPEGGEDAELATKIDPRFIANIRGKDVPTWPGVIDAATRAGLRSLTTRLVQIPTAENGQLAVVIARAEFEGGRVFEDVGDCSPQSTSPQLAAASIRLASTRAKGRVLRDALNVGVLLAEDLSGPAAPPQRGQPQRQPQPQRQQPQQQRPQQQAAPYNGGAVAVAPMCSAPECGVHLTQKEVGACNARKINRLFCEHHLNAFLARLAKAG